MTGHIADDAAGLASLPSDDADRRAAYDHAVACPPCARALREAERLLVVIDGAPPPKPPSEVVLRRALGAIVAEMDGAKGFDRIEKAGSKPRARFWATLAVAVSALFALFDARGHALAWAGGVECLLIEIGTAAIAVGVAALVIENRAGVGRAPAYAALAGWSAVVAQGYLHFRCPVGHEAAHLVAFHLGGVVLATLFGPPLGARVARLSS
jgi:hypothetical protein